MGAVQIGGPGLHREAGVGDEEDPVFAALSPRKRQILACVARGFSNARIGTELFISDKTVRSHITRIFDKLGVSTRAQAIVLAKDGKLTPQDFH